MSTILVSSILIFLSIVLFIILLIKTIRNKVKKEPIKGLVLLIFIPFFTIGLSIYDGFLVLSYLNDNKGKILDASQAAISDTIEFGTTALFEGVGQSWDDFEAKWEDKFVTKLKKVDVEIQNVMTESHDDKHDMVTVDLIFNNKNVGAEYLSIDTLGTNNYLLIGDENEIYYPVSIQNGKNYNYLPSGKTLLQVKGKVPTETKISYFRMLNQKHSISNIN
jgi:hypothetical protein